MRKTDIQPKAVPYLLARVRYTSKPSIPEERSQALLANETNTITARLAYRNLSEQSNLTKGDSIVFKTAGQISELGIRRLSS